MASPGVYNANVKELRDTLNSSYLETTEKTASIFDLLENNETRKVHRPPYRRRRRC